MGAVVLLPTVDGSRNWVRGAERLIRLCRRKSRYRSPVPSDDVSQVQRFMVPPARLGEKKHMCIVLLKVKVSNRSLSYELLSLKLGVTVSGPYGQELLVSKVSGQTTFFDGECALTTHGRGKLCYFRSNGDQWTDTLPRTVAPPQGRLSHWCESHPVRIDLFIIFLCVMAHC